jgi:hypothetical protein
MTLILLLQGSGTGLHNQMMHKTMSWVYAPQMPMLMPPHVPKPTLSTQLTWGYPPVYGVVTNALGIWFMADTYAVGISSYGIVTNALGICFMADTTTSIT